MNTGMKTLYWPIFRRNGEPDGPWRCYSDDCARPTLQEAIDLATIRLNTEDFAEAKVLDCWGKCRWRSGRDLEYYI